MQAADPVESRRDSASRNSIRTVATRGSRRSTSAAGSKWLLMTGRR